MSRMISAGTTMNQQGSLIHRRPSLDTDTTLFAGMKKISATSRQLTRVMAGAKKMRHFYGRPDVTFYYYCFIVMIKYHLD